MRCLALGRALLLAVGGCADPVTAVFAVPDDGGGGDFYALPFPNDRWWTPAGTLDLSRFPTNSLLIDAYRAAAEELDGFGLNHAVFARFEGGLDPDSLPTPAESTGARASVYLVDVDPASPDRGTRVPVQATFREEAGRRSGRTTSPCAPTPASA